jgi:DDE_Tnp_1-associated
MTTDLLTCLATIPDRRRAEGKIYGQAGVILFSILAMVSGARSYRQIHTLIDRRLGLLNAAFPGAALRRAPAYTSVRGILQGLDEAELEQAFRRHAEGLDHTCGASPSRFVAIDGKTLQGQRMKVCDPMAGALSGRSQVRKPCRTRQRAGPQSRLLTYLGHKEASCVSPGFPDRVFRRQTAQKQTIRPLTA